MAGKEVRSKARHEQDYAAVESGRSNEQEPLLERRDGSVDYTWSAVIVAFLFPAVGGLLFGYDVGATSRAVVSLTLLELSGVSWYDLSSIKNGLVASGSLFAALPGSLLAFSIADSLGRRRELIVATFLYGLGALGSTFASSLALLIIGRFVYGFRIGLAMHATPLYISETAPSQIRGTLVSMKEVFNMIGILLEYLVSSLAINSVGGWRTMYGVAALIAIIMGVGVWWLPPSPRWVLLQEVTGKRSRKEAEKEVKAVFELCSRQSMEEVSGQYKHGTMKISLQF